MSSIEKPRLAALPSVDSLLRNDLTKSLVAEYGRTATVHVIRQVLRSCRSALRNSVDPMPEQDDLVARVRARLEEEAAPSLRPVMNLTGTVLHTNLGRSALAPEAVEAVHAIAIGAGNLEYRISEGRRGDRDEHVEAQICKLTGAEAATVVNNNAAALMLILNSLALDRSVPVSRGELIEIGGSFRLPDIMSRSGCRLDEVGTTNRTHLRDYAEAVGPETGLIMKVHTSNYVIEGFTVAVSERELAGLCHDHGIPFVVDLGSGALVDFERLGLPHEPTPAEALAQGADLVTFSGDKLLGGPQAGLIAGRRALIEVLRNNPMKRALRCDKMTIAALSATLRLYANPDRAADQIPALRTLVRPQREIRDLAIRLRPKVARVFDGRADVAVTDCDSQVGSGALPMRTLPSAGLAITVTVGGRRGDRMLRQIAAAFRALPVPVLGRIHGNRFLLDFRCLEDGDIFERQLELLEPKE